jgi:hypothetical protein
MMIDEIKEFLANEYNDANHDEAGTYEAGVRFLAMATINYINELLLKGDANESGNRTD